MLIEVFFGIFCCCFFYSVDYMAVKYGRVSASGRFCFFNPDFACVCTCRIYSTKSRMLEVFFEGKFFLGFTVLVCIYFSALSFLHFQRTHCQVTP